MGCGVKRFFVALALFLPSISNSQQHNDDSSNSYTVGGIFISNASILEFENIFKKHKDGITFITKTIKMDQNPIRAALEMSEHLISQKVCAIVTSHNQEETLATAAISYMAGYHHVPVIDISSRDSSFSDKTIHTTFLRTVSPYSHQAEVWSRILLSMKYTRVIFIHSSDVNGRAILGRFQATSRRLDRNVPVFSPLNVFTPAGDEMSIHVDAAIEFDPGLKDFTKQLAELKTLQTKVYLLYASSKDSEVIFRDANSLNMTKEGYVWLVTEQALDSENVPVGTLGLRLRNASNTNGHFQDVKYILAAGLLDMKSLENITDEQYDSNDSGPAWDIGKVLFENILKQVLSNGTTGRVAFDENGDRANSEYELINVQDKIQDKIKRQELVGQYTFGNQEMDMVIHEEAIVWPGKLQTKPNGFIIPKHLNVLTIKEIPFVYVREATWKTKAKDDSHLRRNLVNKFRKAYYAKETLSGLEEMCSADELPCLHLHVSENTHDDAVYCCKGFCIDLLKELAKKLNFTFNLALSPDGEFGSYIVKNISIGRKKQWTGLVGELVAGISDMVVAPLTISPERSEFIDFSKPFKYQGMTILEKKPSRSATLMSFLQPFSNMLWLLVLASVHVVALVLCLLDRFSPFSRFKIVTPQGDSSDGHPTLASNCPSTITTHTEEDALNLSSAIWFAWGVLLNSGIGDGTPRSFSARVLGIVWAAFAMMIVASYTANLAAFLVLERPYAKPTGINDAVLLNSFGNLDSATVKGSAVEMYFQRQVELSSLFHKMEVKNYKTSEEAIEDIKNGKLLAFIWDNSRLEFEAAMDCELVTTGELFGRAGYGVGLQKESPWTDPVTLEILDFHEGGFIDSLDEKWFPQQDIQCDGINPTEKRPNTLGLKNMAGVFILVLAGIVGGVALIVIEVVYKRHHAKMQNRRELARYALDKWRSVVVKRRYIRATVAAHQQMMKERRMRSNGINENSAPPMPSSPNEYPIGALVPASVGNMGSVAVAATAVDLKQQMSPRLEIVQFSSFTESEDSCSICHNSSP